MQAFTGVARLVDANGDPIGPVATAQVGELGGEPGIKTVVYDVPGGAAALEEAVAVSFGQNAFQSRLQYSWPQIVAC